MGAEPRIESRLREIELCMLKHRSEQPRRLAPQRGRLAKKSRRAFNATAVASNVLT